MATLQQISRSISVAEDLDSIVGTMKGLAAVSVRQYERAREASQDYIENLERGFQIVLRHGIEPNSSRTRATPVGVFIFGTEQGLCGPLNRQVLEHAGTWIAEEGLTRDDRRIVGVGKRLGEELRAFSLDAEDVVAHPSSVQGVSSRIEDLLFRIDEWRDAGVTDVVAFYHSRPTGTRAHPVTRQILPIERDLLVELGERPWKTNMLPQVAGSAEAVFRVLTRQLVVARLFIAFVDALASEHGERLIAMQGAESNIEERLDNLQGEFRRERQTAITSELLDLISGYEMMSEDDDERTIGTRQRAGS